MHLSFNDTSDHPFTLPDVKPATKYLWKNIKRIMIGIIVMTEPAINVS